MPKLRLVKTGAPIDPDAAYRDGTARTARIAECETKDGHPYTGEYEYDYDHHWVWFTVIDNKDNEYQTIERPVYLLKGLTLIHFQNPADALEFINRS